MTFFVGFFLIVLLIPVNYLLIQISKKRMGLTFGMVGAMFLSNITIMGLYMFGTIPPQDDNFVSYVVGICLAVFLNMLFKIIYMLNEPKGSVLHI